MAAALSKAGVSVDVATTDDDGPRRRMDTVVCGAFEQREGFRVIHFAKQTEFYKVSLPLMTWLLRHVTDYDAVHMHAVFSFSTLAAGWACRLHGVPYVVRPLGVLNSWGMENRRRWIKSLSFHIFDKPILNRAAAMHYTSGQERDDAARLGIHAPAVVIPLGIDFQASHLPQEEGSFMRSFPNAAGRQIVLFLSRLDPKKNLELLLDAMAGVLSSESGQIRPNPANSDPVLVIAGSGDPTYTSSLENRANELGLSRDVIWAGHLTGVVKQAAFAAATLFVLPSRSENFGIALLEAMSAGLPCVSTVGVALAADAAREGAVRLCETEAGALAATIAELLASKEKRSALAACAAQVAREKYSTEGMARSLKVLYQTALR